MLETRRGSWDAHSVKLYEKDFCYDIPHTLATQFISQSYATELDAMGEMFQVGKVRGAQDFCEFLRGKVPADALLAAWEEFDKRNDWIREKAAV